MNNISHHWLELVLLVVILLTALALRLWQLDTVPVGLHFDEAIDLWQGELVAGGARPIYISEGWGREVLYYYLVAGVLQVVANNMLALRVTAVLCSLGTILTAFFFARRAFNRPTALLTAALLALNFWSLFTARFGVRHVTLPLLLGLTILAFWWAWYLPASRRQLAAYCLTGLLLGLTLYTYQSARFAPFIFLFFLLYLLLFHRPIVRQQWRGFSIMPITAVLVVTPLIIVVQNASIELATRDWLVIPLTKLLEGDLRPVLQNSLAALKMFSFAGDPLIAYNVPGRPVFVPAWIALFLYAGVGVALWRWRQPVYAFLLIWMAVMLAPTILTVSAPNYNRTIAAQVPVMLLTAVGMVEIARWVARRAGPRAAAVPILLILLALWLLGQNTLHDYFYVWPQQELIPIQYGALPSVAARVLETDPDDRPVTINTRSIEDADPIIFHTILDRSDLEVRWVDSSMALVMPANQSETRLLVGADRWIDSTLSQFAHMPPQPIFANDYVALYETRVADWQQLDAVDKGSAVSFGNSIQLRGVYLRDGANGFHAVTDFQTAPLQTIQSGDTFTFLTDWNVLQNGEAISLAFFVHLLNENHELVAQQDGLGFPPHSWHTGDQMVHVHQLQTPADLPPGLYWVQLGLYRRETGERWLLDDGSGDQLVLGQIVVGE